MSCVGPPAPLCVFVVFVGAGGCYICYVLGSFSVAFLVLVGASLIYFPQPSCGWVHVLNRALNLPLQHHCVNTGIVALSYGGGACVAPTARPGPRLKTMLNQHERRQEYHVVVAVAVVVCPGCGCEKPDVGD